MTRNTWTNWKQIDWKDRRDVDIAEELGVSRQCVNAARQRHAPGTIQRSRHPRAPRQILQRRAAMREWLKKNEKLVSKVLCKADLLRIFACASTMLDSILDEAGISPGRGRTTPYSLFNWDLPSTVLADLWDAHYPLVVRHRKHDPKWDLRVVSWQKDEKDSKAYKKAVQEEKKKKAEWDRRMAATDDRKLRQSFLKLLESKRR